MKWRSIFRRSLATAALLSTAPDPLKHQAPVWRDFWRSGDSRLHTSREASTHGSRRADPWSNDETAFLRGWAVTSPWPRATGARARPRTPCSTVVVALAVADGV